MAPMWCNEANKNRIRWRSFICDFISISQNRQGLNVPNDTMPLYWVFSVFSSFFSLASVDSLNCNFPPNRTTVLPVMRLMMNISAHVTYVCVVVVVVVVVAKCLIAASAANTHEHLIIIISPPNLRPGRTHCKSNIDNWGWCIFTIKLMHRRQFIALQRWVFTIYFAPFRSPISDRRCVHSATASLALGVFVAGIFAMKCKATNETKILFSFSQ